METNNHTNKNSDHQADAEGSENTSYQLELNLERIRKNPKSLVTSRHGSHCMSWYLVDLCSFAGEEDSYLYCSLKCQLLQETIGEKPDPTVQHPERVGMSLFVCEDIPYELLSHNLTELQTILSCWVIQHGA
jgi:hypothetical protein